jgi:hypothetical protein
MTLPIKTVSHYQERMRPRMCVPGLEERILDLRRGYWYTALHPGSKEKTKFSTTSGLWQFTDIPLGPFDTPAMFERLMGSTVRDFIYQTCLVYLMM